MLFRRRRCNFLVYYLLYLLIKFQNFFPDLSFLASVHFFSSLSCFLNSISVVVKYNIVKKNYISQLRREVIYHRLLLDISLVKAVSIILKQMLFYGQCLLNIELKLDFQTIVFLRQRFHILYISGFYQLKNIKTIHFLR